MPLLDIAPPIRTGNVWREERPDEAGALKSALTAARSNPWLAEDIGDPEFESFMDAIQRPVPARSTAPIERDRPNPWQEFFEAAR